jgi:hypothetical protein
MIWEMKPAAASLRPEPSNRTGFGRLHVDPLRLPDVYNFSPIPEYKIPMVLTYPKTCFEIPYATSYQYIGARSVTRVKHSLATSQRATKRSEDGWTGPL